MQSKSSTKQQKIKSQQKKSEQTAAKSSNYNSNLNRTYKQDVHSKHYHNRSKLSYIALLTFIRIYASTEVEKSIIIREVNLQSTNHSVSFSLCRSLVVV